MAHYEVKVDPNGSGPLEHVEAYVSDSGEVFYPGDEGYVEKPVEAEEGVSGGGEDEAGVEPRPPIQGATVDPTAGSSENPDVTADAGSPLDLANNVDK